MRLGAGTLPTPNRAPPPKRKEDSEMKARGFLFAIKRDVGDANAPPDRKLAPDQRRVEVIILAAAASAYHRKGDIVIIDIEKDSEAA